MLRLNPVIRCGLCASALAFTFPVSAEESEEKKQDTLVVTASAVEINLKEAPASISIITAEEIKRKPVQNLRDVLRDQPGVQLNNDGSTPGGYVLWNTGASWQATKAIKLRAGVLNLADKDLNRDSYSYNEDGRRYFAALDYTF